MLWVTILECLNFILTKMKTAMLYLGGCGVGGAVNEGLIDLQ